MQTATVRGRFGGDEVGVDVLVMEEMEGYWQWRQMRLEKW